MRRRTMAIIIAVVLAFAAVALVIWYVSSLRQQTAETEPTQAVLVAKVGVQANVTGDAIIEQGLVEARQVVVSSVAPGAVADAAALQGKVLLVPVAAGQQLLQSQFGAPEQQYISHQLKSGMRAISLPVDQMTAVGGAIKPGDRVDVVVTFQLEQFQQVQLPLGAALSPVDAARIQAITGLDLSTLISPASKVMLEQVDVLAIDPVTEASPGSAGASDQNQGQQVPKVPLITLMVTPADAEKLVFAEEFGSIWFTLVPVGDTSPVSTPGQALPGLLR